MKPPDPVTVFRKHIAEIKERLLARVPNNHSAILKPVDWYAKHALECELNLMDDSELLAFRQARYMEGKMDGLTSCKAAKEAGFPSKERDAPLKLIETTALRAEMQAAMQRQGATYDRMAQTVVKAMDATAYATFEGEVRDSSLPDHKVRVGAVKLAADLMGVTRPDAAAGAQTAIVINLPGVAAKWFGSSE